MTRNSGSAFGFRLCGCKGDFGGLSDLCRIQVTNEVRHLIFQSHGLELHFCFGFSVFFGRQKDMFESFVVPFAHQERQMKILKM